MGRKHMKIPEPAKPEEEAIVSEKKIDQDVDELESLIKLVWSRMVVDHAKQTLGDPKVYYSFRTDASYSASSKKYNVKIDLLYDCNWSTLHRKVKTITVKIAPSKNHRIVTKRRSWGSKYKVKEVLDPSYVHFRMNIPALDEVRLKDLVSLAKRVMSGVGK